MIQNDRQLINSILNGDEASIVQFWKVWTKKIHAFLKNSGLKSDDEFEDVTQEILYKVFNALDQYNPLYSPSTWIYTICRNHFIDLCNSQKQYQLEEYIDQIESKDNLEESIIRQDSIKEVRNFVKIQSNIDKQIIQLHFYESLSIRATSRILKYPYETIRYRVKRIKMKAKAYFNE